MSGTALAVQLRRPDETPMATTAPGVRLADQLREARGGETITLAAGDYGMIKFPRRTYQPAIRIAAGAARFTGLVMRQVEGVTISGGTVVGPGGRSYGVTINGARDVTLENMTITGAHRGIVLGRSDRVMIRQVRFTGLLSDGINIANASNVTVRDSSCRDFSPTRTVYDARGKRVTVGDHPDCIQAWSRPKSPPTSDIRIENNDIEGDMQGVFFGNHVRDGVDDGGFDRITIRGNRIRVNHPNGILLAGARNSVVTGNVVSSIPGARNSRSGSPVKAWISVKDGSGNTACGNKVADIPESPAARACK